jgi:hypothetical protein
VAPHRLHPGNVACVAGRAQEKPAQAKKYAATFLGVEDLSMPTQQQIISQAAKMFPMITLLATHCPPLYFVLTSSSLKYQPSHKNVPEHHANCRTPAHVRGTVLVFAESQRGLIRY